MKGLQLDHIVKNYQMGEVLVPVLKGVSLRIGEGEFLALTGPSGSGKSTLMNIMGCLDRPTSGEYRLEDELVSSMTSAKLAEVRNRLIGFVFQSFQLLPRMSAMENVELPLLYSKEAFSQAESNERAIQLLKKVGLEERIHHEPSQLSGGQQQRVAIARALVNRPAILFADEPTGNLDPKTSEAILALLAELNEEEKITIILVTHDQNVAARAKRRVLLKDGQIENDSANQTI